MPDRRKPPPSESDLKANQADALADLKQARADHAERNIADRRNVLLGTFITEHIARNPKLRDYVEKHVYKFHKRERDQAFLRDWLDQLAEKQKPSE